MHTHVCNEDANAHLDLVNNRKAAQVNEKNGSLISALSDLMSVAF